MKKRNRFDLVRGEDGASLVEAMFLLPLFMVLMCAAFDLGQAFYLAIEVAGAAHAGAVYGAQSPTDTTGMQTVAKDSAPDVPSLSVPTPTYGCECSNKTSYVASCTAPPTCSGSTEINIVSVTVKGTYTPLFRWPGIPKTMSLSSSASMRSAGS